MRNYKDLSTDKESNQKDTGRYCVKIYKQRYSQYVYEKSYYFNSTKEGNEACKRLYRENPEKKVELWDGRLLLCFWENGRLTLYFLPKHTGIMASIIETAIDVTDYKCTSTSVLVDNKDGELTIGDCNGRLNPIPVNMTEDLFNNLCEIEKFVKSRGFKGIDNILFSPRNPNKCRNLEMIQSKSTSGLATILYNL